jgi:hypothetical protein
MGKAGQPGKAGGNSNRANLNLNPILRSQQTRASGQDKFLEKWLN